VVIPNACAEPCSNGERAATTNAPPFISIVLPVRNEGQTIERVLRELLLQDYDPNRFEIIVADGLSTDSTRDVVTSLCREHGNLKLLDNSKRLASAGRNVGVSAALGDIILIVDGHCDVGAPDYLTRLAEAFARSEADCIGRPQPLDIPGAAALQRAIASARSSWLGHHPDSYSYSSTERFVRPQSVAVAYRRAVIDAVGPFDEDFDACEDVEFNTRVERVGFRCFLSPQLRIRYHPRTTLVGLFRQLARYGRGRMRLLRKHPESFGWSCFVPLILVLGIVIGPGLAWFGPAGSAVYLTGLGAYLAIVLTMSLALAVKSKDIAASAWLPLVFITIHFAAGVGVLQECALGRRRAKGAAAVQADVPAPGQTQGRVRRELGR
jgi:succinoglycan biosynthesis protein ExoA